MLKRPFKDPDPDIELKVGCSDPQASHPQERTHPDVVRRLQPYTGSERRGGGSHLMSEMRLLMSLDIRSLRQILDRAGGAQIHTAVNHVSGKTLSIMSHDLSTSVKLGSNPGLPVQPLGFTFTRVSTCTSGSVSCTYGAPRCSGAQADHTPPSLRRVRRSGLRSS